jgi:hypothetical protein
MNSRRWEPVSFLAVFLMMALTSSDISLNSGDPVEMFQEVLAAPYRSVLNRIFRAGKYKQAWVNYFLRTY